MAINSTIPRSNTIKLILIIFLPFMMLLLAWLALKTNTFPKNYTNHGKILPIEVKLTDLDFNFVNNKESIEQSANWKLLIAGCLAKEQQLCDDVIHMNRQVLTALGKNSKKVIQIYANIEENIESDILNKFNASKDTLYTLDTNKKLQTELKLPNWPAANFFLIDPLNRIIMQYDPKQTGKPLLEDLTKLLSNKAINK